MKALDADGLNQRLANLSPAKKALLELRLKQNRCHEQAIPRRPSRDSAPLSFAQQRLWFLNQLEPESPAYNESRAYRLNGVLHMTALQKALDQIVARHEVLRTNFVSVDGNPTQVIAETRPVELPRIDLSAWPESGREAEARRLLLENVRRPFDLSREAMLRVMLLCLDEQEHILLVVKHHIASDGWSSGIFWQELADLYRSLIAGGSSALPELPIQYADFAVWQRNRLQGDILEAQLAYWKKQLDGVESLRLPTDRRRSATSTSPGAKQSLTFPRELSDGLKALSRQQGATLFMTLLAAFQTLLNRYTGQTDIAVGTPIAGRTRLEVEKLIGFFVNTLVLRTDCSNDPTFRELLDRVKQKAVDAYAHQELPFEKLVEVLQPERNIGGSPLFHVTFQVQNTPRSSNDLPGLTLSPVEVASGTAKFDLSLSMREEPDGLKATLDYNTDLFDGETISRMLGHLQVLLDGIVTDPDRPISALPILTEPERHQLLVEWNDTKREYPKDKCIPELFEEQAEKTPDAAAVVFEGEQLTYGELNARANQLAHHLRKLGVGPEVLVGICVERSLEMVVGLLGILKAGGAYVPLDPEYPKDRLAFQLEDTRSRVLLTQERLLAALPEHDGRVICLDRDWAEIARESEANPESGVTAENLAYVIYTSGSTGKPKGVMIQHRALSNHMLWMQERFPLDRVDCVLQKTPFCFDASVWEFFAPIMAGARLALARPGGHQDGAYLINTIANQQVTTLQLVPSMLRMLLAEDGLERCQNLKRVFCGGEALPVELREQFHGRLGGELHNLYGPTEATIDATCALCDRASPPHTVAIGRPIANTQVYVLDPDLQPIPIGVPGELYIGGECLARGYLNRPKLTAEMFITHSFDGEPARRLYKTGDLARYLSDGNIEFLGRIDNQVKIRGYRIELGEIESVLSRHPGVRESVVVAREDAPGDKRLVAYIVASQSPLPSTGDFRAYLQRALPDYMIPSAYVFLDSLPLTPNGKVDRKALPAPDRNRDGLEQAYVAPRSPTEEILAGIWAEVLKLDQVGVHDNFFDLGGHSLLATQVISRLRVTLQMELPLRCLFENPTVSGLADRIEETRRQEQGLQSCPIQSVSRAKDLPLSFSQQRLWFLDQYEPGSSVYNIPSAIRLTGALDVSALEQSFQEIVNRHEALRTTFPMVEGEAVQVIAPSLKLALAVVDLSETPEAEREEEAQGLAREEAQRPFDLSRGPLFRTRLLQLGKEDHVLLMTLHHIVSDGWSMGVMYHELSVLYQAFSNSQPSPLPDLPIQYADYTVWQRNWLQGDVLERQLAYWKKQLEGVSPLQLPTDRPRPPIQTHRGARQSLILPKELLEKLRSLSRKGGVTLYMTLLAAFQTLLSRYTGQTDIVVGSPIAGRTRSELEGLIGFFVNTLVYRNDLSGDPSFNELLANVREGALKAYEHQDLPFEKLVEELNPERRVSHSPVFQVLFAVQNVPRQKFEIPGVTATPLDIDSITAKFDLFAAFVERDGQLMLRMEYDADLFNADTIERMVGHFRTLLEGIVATPERRICELPLLTETERHKLLVDWNDTRRDISRGMNVIEIFEEQVQLTPDAVAVVFENTRLNYRELNQRANQLAHYLIRQGVRAETHVAVCLERSLELAIGLLAILKAGGVYVPLDPTYPRERLTLMLRDMQAPLIVSVQSLASQLSSHGAQSIFLETEQQNIAREDTSNPRPAIASHSSAYLLYTSGSTGKPKGVVMGHRALGNLISWQIKNFSEPLPARTLQFASLGFDVSIQEMFATWCVGGSLLFIKDELRRDGLRLLQYLEEESVERIFLPFVALQHLADAAAYGNCFPQSLREIITAGEQLQLTESLRSFLNRLGDCCLRNQYGPTESHVVTEFTLKPPFGHWPDLPPIGRPIANTEIYILDSHLNPVPIGVVGEIYVGGDGLARGYLNRPELTAEKFITDPFSSDPEARLYKTGDLARYVPDGNIEFLGRIDNQVKIRGYRIELGEIESVLSRHPGVRQSVVVAREDAPGDKRLVAYIVANQENALTTQELRNYLKQKLPDYMIASAFVFLASIPLSANGKVDRQALAESGRSAQKSKESSVAPRDHFEQRLTEIFATLLGIPSVSVNDNFFDLGGHSLLAVRLMSQIEKALNKSFPIATIFQAPTVEQLAALLRENAPESRWSSMVPVQPLGSRAPFFWVHGEVSNVFLPRYLGPDQPIYGFKHQGEEGYPALNTRVEGIAAQYLDEMRDVQDSGPYYLGGYCFGGLVAFEMAHQLRRRGEEVALLFLLDPSNPRNGQSSAFFAGQTIALSDRGSVGTEIQRHLRNLERLEPNDKFTYVVSRSLGKIRKVTSPVGMKIQRVIYKVCLKLGYRIPPSLRSRYILDVYVKAMKSYAPNACDGRIVIFERVGYVDRAKQWEQLALGGFRLHEVSGSHQSVIQEPCVQVWAEKLKSYLQSA